MNAFFHFHRGIIYASQYSTLRVIIRNYIIIFIIMPILRHAHTSSCKLPAQKSLVSGTQGSPALSCESISDGDSRPQSNPSQSQPFPSCAIDAQHSTAHVHACMHTKQGKAHRAQQPCKQLLLYMFRKRKTMRNVYSPSDHLTRLLLRPSPNSPFSCMIQTISPPPRQHRLPTRPLRMVVALNTQNSRNNSLPVSPPLPCPIR